MAAVAKRAGVSEPTLYRHFPTKRDLFAALAGYQFHSVAGGLAPASADDLADAVGAVYQRAAGLENLVRWTLAATDPQRIPRPNVEARLAMLRTALGNQACGSDGEFLVRTVLLLTSPMAWLYWKDYLGLDAANAAATAGWAIKTQPARNKHHARGRPSQKPGGRPLINRSVSRDPPGSTSVQGPRRAGFRMSRDRRTGWRQPHRGR
jgi:AcrR family transcriptional regulator